MPEEQPKCKSDPSATCRYPALIDLRCIACTMGQLGIAKLNIELGGAATLRGPEQYTARRF